VARRRVHEPVHARRPCQPHQALRGLAPQRAAVARAAEADGHRAVRAAPARHAPAPPAQQGAGASGPRGAAGARRHRRCPARAHECWPGGVHHEPEPGVVHHLLAEPDQPGRPGRVHGVPGGGHRHHGGRGEPQRVGLLPRAGTGRPT
jgi:hypothetical protein